MPRYATTTDLARIGIASNALASIDTAAKEDALDACSSLADGYLSGRYTLPLSAWADDLRLHVAGMAEPLSLVVDGGWEVSNYPDLTTLGN